MQEVYASLLIAVGVDEYSAQIQLDHCSMLGVKFRDMANLLSPDAVFSMEQSAVPLDLGSLLDLKEDNAYGLCIDFHRFEKGSHMQFIDARGNEVFEITPPGSYSETMSSNKQNPDYINIMNVAHNLTSTKAQFMRLMQCLTQTPLIFARSYASLFPGVIMSEHGGYPVTIKEQNDGSVLVGIRSGDRSNMDFKTEIKVNIDGSHEVLSCTLKRRS